MYYTVIEHSRHLRTLEKCRKHEPQARVFYISLEFSNARRVLSQCNTRLRLLYLLRKRLQPDLKQEEKMPVLSSFKLSFLCVWSKLLLFLMMMLLLLLLLLLLELACRRSLSQLGKQKQDTALLRILFVFTRSASVMGLLTHLTESTSIFSMTLIRQ